MRNLLFMCSYSVDKRICRLLSVTLIAGKARHEIKYIYSLPHPLRISLQLVFIFKMIYWFHILLIQNHYYIFCNSGFYKFCGLFSTIVWYEVCLCCVLCGETFCCHLLLILRSCLTKRFFCELCYNWENYC